jgi:hypothetical protein
MITIPQYFKQRRFQVHILAFLLMILPPVAMYFAAQQGITGAIWALLALVVLGNLLALLA